ncbi:hypothetical protein ACT3CE_04175 [Marinifilum sp. RC60d5]|uniref:hypothetical protein n=1 Tax=Marinifilum sp. RC60d5 TaxID=3458414 RepID=UPI004035C6B4
MNISVNKTRFYIYAIALLPFIILLATGVILLKYHTGSPLDSTLMGFDAHFWFPFHKILAILSTPLLLLHLFVKTDWVKKLFTLKLKDKYKISNLLLFITFSLCMLTAFSAAFIFPDTDMAKILGGIHNKLGLLLLLIFVIHLWNYRKVIINQFRNLEKKF